MGNSVFACQGGRANGMTAGMLVSRFTPPLPVGIVPPPPPLGTVPVDVDEEIYLVDLAILSIVVLVSWI